jgi:metal-responsive CopG/Arc/MetJ family transcriptional regulator
MSMKRIYVSMPEPLRKRLDSESERSGLLLSEMIRAAIDSWLACKERESMTPKHQETKRR